jgi:hypothetical protein
MKSNTLRKGVIAMKYHKPRMIPLGVAANAIQGGKAYDPLLNDGIPEWWTIASYQADE